MVNHFATLLFNHTRTPVESVYTSSVFLADGFGNIITDEELNYIAVEASMTQQAQTDELNSKLLNRNFTGIQLPPPLARFHNILFPQDFSTKHKHFLLYCYLRIVAASDRSSDTLTHDQRLTYNLDEIKDYFKFSKIVVNKNNNPYSLLVSGKYEAPEESEDRFNSFVIKQKADTSDVFIYSATQRLFYSPTKPASRQSEGMEVSLNIAPGTNSSSSISVGDTGLQFVLTRPNMSDNFNSTGNKLWSFNAQIPYFFSTTDKFEELLQYQDIVDGMLNYSITNSTYQNIWKQHFNPVYRMAGLLLAYVDKVHTLWHT